MVNYYPVNHAGYEMWSSTNYSGATYEADLARAKGLGFNCARVFISAYSGSFSFPSPTSPQLANLTDFYSQSKTAGIKLRLCLFDWWSQWGYVSGSTTWAQAILGALPDFTNIHSIELQNEVAFAETSNVSNPYSGGFDAGWPSGVTQYGNIGQVCQVWAQQMVPVIRAAAPGVPVTCSTTAVPSYNLASGVAALTGGLALDWWEWHCYQPQGALLYWLRQAVETVGSVSNLYIGETGKSSTPTYSLTSPQAAQIEADYIAECRLACAALGLPEPSPWMLYDANPSAQFSGGQTFGLYDTTATIKPAGSLYASNPPGSPGTPSSPRLASSGTSWSRLT